MLAQVDAKLRQVQRIKKKMMALGVDEEDIFECFEACVEDLDSAQEFDFFVELPKARPLLHQAVQTINDIINLGIVIKDVDLGLIDFPSWFEGREVYLCHKLGETRVQFWHEVDEGFRGRQPIFELNMMLDDTQ